MYYKKVYRKEIISKKEIEKQKKLISLYNQLNGTSYTLDSVGIELVHKVNPGNYVYGKPDTNFGWYTRTGIPYNKNFSNKEKKELKRRRLVQCSK